MAKSRKTQKSYNSIKVSGFLAANRRRRLGLALLLMLVLLGGGYLFYANYINREVPAEFENGAPPVPGIFVQ